MPGLVTTIRADSDPVPIVKVRPGVVRPPSWLDWDLSSYSSPQLVRAWIVSGIIHVVVLCLLTQIRLSAEDVTLAAPGDVYASSLDPEPIEPNLELDEAGNGPTQMIGYNVNRLDDYAAPGLERLTESVGAPEIAPLPTLSAEIAPGTGPGWGIVPVESGPAESTGVPSPSAGGSDAAKFELGGFSGRSAATRLKLLMQGGGNTRSEAAVAAGLKWLCDHQAPDGRWSFHDYPVHGKCNCSGAGKANDIAATALALLPLLGAGETHRGSEGRHLYTKNVERGLRFLMSRQASDGQLGNAYAHPLATLALCEAYGMTNDPALAAPARKAICWTIVTQHKAGGWRYLPREPGDTSVTGWQVQALKSAQLAGLVVPPSTLHGINNYLNAVANADGSEYRYAVDQDGTPSMNAVGLLCREYMGWGPDKAGLQKGVQLLLKQLPSPRTRNIYYCYYATQVLYHFGGEAWDSWNPRMMDLLIDSQETGSDPKRRHLRGSWSGDDDFLAAHLGRLGATSLSLLTLEVYYRYLPLYRKELGGHKEEAVRLTN